MGNLIVKNLDEILKDDKKRKIIIIVAFVLILLIFLSSIIPKSDHEIQKDVSTKANQNELEEYREDVTAQILDLVSHIDGVGRAKVMVTLQNSEEILYEYDTKIKNDDNTTDKEQQVVIVDDENGNKNALIKTKKLPKIKGVVVVCDGALDIDVEYRVTNAIKTAFGLSSLDVCVVLHDQSDIKG